MLPVALHVLVAVLLKNNPTLLINRSERLFGVMSPDLVRFSCTFYSFGFSDLLYATGSIHTSSIATKNILKLLIDRSQSSDGVEWMDWSDYEISIQSLICFLKL